MPEGRFTALLQEKQGVLSAEPIEKPETRFTGLLETKQKERGVFVEPEEEFTARQQLLEKVYFGETDDIATQSEIAKELSVFTDNPAEGITRIENRYLLSSLFEVPLEDVEFMESGMVKQLYGKPIDQISSLVINKNLKEDLVGALKESPENLWIGTIGLTAGVLEGIKLDAIQLAGGGALPDEAIRHQFEAITPDPVPGIDSLRDPADANNYIYREDAFDFLRPQRPLPGAITAEAFGILTRLPDIGAKILRKKQGKLAETQSIALMSNAPITKLMRTTVQSGVPSMGAAVGISLLTGNPLVGLVMLGQSEGGAAFQRQLNEGGSVQKAIIIGRLSEAAEIGGEMLVLPGIVKGFKEGLSIRRGLTLIAENAGQEGITGFNQAFLEVFGTETTKGTNNTLAAKMAFVAGVEAVPENAFVGGATAGAASGVGVSADVVRGLASPAQARKAIDDIIEQVKADIATEEAEAAEAVEREAAPIVDEAEVVEGLEGVRGVFDPQNPPVAEGRSISAIKLDDGTILFDTEAKIHSDMLESLNVNPADIADGGFIVDGKYVSGSADIPRIAEQAKAQRKVAERLAKQEAVIGGKVIEPETQVAPVSGEIEGVVTEKSAVDEEIPEIPEAKRIISKEAFDAALKRFTDQGKLRTGLDPQMIKDATVIGGYLLETGVRKFSAWSADMVKRLGESVKPHLRSIWDAVQVERKVKAVQLAKELPLKAAPVKAVPAIQIVSPGQAGPLKITFKATKDLGATKIIIDPKVRRAVQAAENKIAELKTKLKQAQADKKVAVVKATQVQIAKAEAQVAKLKERQNIKLANTIEKAKVIAARIEAAKEFKDSLRRDAISTIRAIPKDQQAAFILEASRADSLKKLQHLSDRIQKGIERIEKREAISDMKKAAKAIKPERMLPEFAATARSIIDSIQLGKLQEDTQIKNDDLRAMAQQILETAREDSVAAFQAQQILKELQGKTAKTFAINQLSLESINQITDSLIALRFQNEADTIAAKDENAKEAVRRRTEINETIKKPPKIPRSLGGKKLKKFKLIHDNLESVTDASSGARPGTYDLWKKNKRALTKYIYDILNVGVDNQIIHSKKTRDILRGILSDNNVTSRQILEWSLRPEQASRIKGVLSNVFDKIVTPKVHKFTLKDFAGEATEFEFTANELMSIFMHSQNSHNLAVIMTNGMDRIVEKEKQKIRGFTTEVIDDMIDTLTDQQKKVARQVGSKLMDGFNRDSINKASTKLEFFEIAKVENYWPARRSIIGTLRGQALKQLLTLVESMGLLKQRVGIGNPMRMTGFFETVHASSKNVATYVGLAEPLREVKAVYNQEVVENMENIGRGEEAQRINKFVEQIEGNLIPVFETDLDAVVAKMLGGFAKAKLFLRPKLALRQQISEFLVSAYVDMKYMTEFRGIATKELIAEITKLSPQLGTARFEGLQFDRDIGDAFQQNELMNYLTGDVTLIDKTAMGLRFFDTNAIVDIYRATKAEVIDKNPGIDINSTEGQALLKDRFEWVVRHTQPMWHVKDRSLLGASKKPLVRALTMFMSQREQLVRMVNNGISDFANSEKTLEDTTRLGRSLGAVSMNMALFTLFNLAWAVVIQKRDRDVKDLMRDVVKDIISLPFFGTYFAASFAITFNILVDKPVFRQAFDDGPIQSILSDILIEAVPNYARAGKHFVSKEKYQGGPNKHKEKWKVEIIIATDSLIDAVASIKGIPYFGAKDTLRSVRVQLSPEEKKSAGSKFYK